MDVFHIFFIFNVFVPACITRADEIDSRSQELLSDNPPCRDDLCVANNYQDPNSPDDSGDPQPRSESETGLTSTDFKCPPLYRKVVRDGAEFCEPMSTEETTRNVPETKQQCQDGETLISTTSGPVCVPTDKDRLEPACTSGEIPVQLDNGVICVEPDPYSINFCPLGHVRVNIEGQLKCYPILNVFGQTSESDIPSIKGKSKKINLNHEKSLSKGKHKTRKGKKRNRNKSKSDRKSVKGSGLKGKKGSRNKGLKGSRKRGSNGLGLKSPTNNLPDCEAGKAPTLTDSGYICVDSVFPGDICPVDQVPKLTEEGSICVFCPSGKIVVQVEKGIKCVAGPRITKPPTTKQPSISSTPTTTVQACPEGLVPLETAVGRVCQYVAPAIPKEEPACPTGQHAVTRDGKTTCEPQRSRECGPGQVLVETPTGETVCGFESNILESRHCPQGLIQVGDQCVYPTENMANDTTVQPGPCPPGQTPQSTETGFTCRYGDQLESDDNRDHHDNSQMIQTRCSTGYILTQMPTGFFCHTLDLQIEDVPGCGKGHVTVKTGHTFECITSYEADLICSGGEMMARSAAGYVCRPGTSHHTTTCSHGEVRSTDEYGASICITLDQASEACGQGYRAVPLGLIFSCKKTRLDLQCPGGFSLELKMAVPTCVSNTGPDCEELSEGDCNPTGIDHLSPCEEGYVVDTVQSMPACSLAPVIPDSSTPVFSGATAVDFQEGIPIEYPDGISFNEPNGITDDLPYYIHIDYSDSGSRSMEFPEKKPITFQNHRPANNPGNKQVHRDHVEQPNSIPVGFPKSISNIHQTELPDYRPHSGPIGYPPKHTFTQTRNQRTLQTEDLPVLNRENIPSRQEYERLLHTGYLPVYQGIPPVFHREKAPLPPPNKMPVKVPVPHVFYPEKVAGGNPNHVPVDHPDIPPGLQPCEDVVIEGVVRPCDLDVTLLLAGCNPECANGGTCLDGVCKCPPGVTGKACHVDVDECQTTDRGSCDYQCENTFGSFHCACANGYTLDTDGTSCVVKGCSPDCLNGGRCLSGQCRCSAGFEGEHCQTDKDECQQYGDAACQHYCRNTYGSYECICPPGSRLNADRRTCTNTTCIPECKNGGQCENSKCICPAGFYGIICQFDLNECYKTQPCQHNCVNTRGSYRCTCNHGYTLHTDQHSCLSI